MEAAVDLGLRKQKSGKVTGTGGNHSKGLRYKNNNFKTRNTPPQKKNKKKEWKQAGTMSPSSMPTGRYVRGKHEKTNEMEQIIMRS